MVANALVSLVAALRPNFTLLEMFFWTKPLGRKVFKLTPEFAEASKTLVANQGLYNGFLTAGLVWGFGAWRHADQAVFPGLRGSGRPVRRSDGGQEDIVRAGVACSG